MDGPEKIWRDALGAGKLLLPVDRETGKAFFPPRVAAPGTGNDIDWIEASGRGTIHSVSVVHPRPPEEPYAVVLVDLEEGARVMGNAATDIEIGTAVTVEIDCSSNEPHLLFSPA